MGIAPNCSSCHSSEPRPVRSLNTRRASTPLMPAKNSHTVLIRSRKQPPTFVQGEQLLRLLRLHQHHIPNAHEFPAAARLFQASAAAHCRCGVGGVGGGDGLEHLELLVLPHQVAPEAQHVLLVQAQQSVSHNDCMLGEGGMRSPFFGGGRHHRHSHAVAHWTAVSPGKPESQSTEELKGRESDLFSILTKLRQSRGSPMPCPETSRLYDCGAGDFAPTEATGAVV